MLFLILKEIFKNINHINITPPFATQLYDSRSLQFCILKVRRLPEKKGGMVNTVNELSLMQFILKKCKIYY